jgi:uncharacterized RDD family membrane protein YckC
MTAAHDPSSAAWTVPPEARVHQGREAGIVSRGVAAGLDFAVVMAVLVGAYFGWAAVRFVLDPRAAALPDPSPGLVGSAFLVVTTVYLAVAWSVTGRSYGQHVMGLRVANSRDRRLGFPHALLRAVLCVGFPVGLLWVVVSRSSRSVQDLLLRTSVTYDWTTHA